MGLPALLALGVNGIVGVGVFFAPGELAQLVPGGALVGLVLATGAALAVVAFAFAALGARFEVNGGPVVYARAAFGDAAGFAIGWLAYVSAIFSASAVVAGLTRAVWPGLAGAPFAARAVAVIVAAALALVCAGGMRLSAAAWSTLTVMKLVPLLALVGLAVFGAARASAAAAGHSGAALVASHPLRAALMMTFLFQGFEVVPVIAGQARSPTRAVPIAVTGSLAGAAALYVALFGVVVRGVPDLAHSAAPLADCARAYGGDGWGRALAITTSVSALGIALGMFATTPHYLAALAPEARFAAMTARGVPLRALGITLGLVAAVVLLGDLAQLFTLSSLAVVLQYGVVSASLVRLAAREGRARGVLLGVAALAVSAALAFAASPFEWAIAAAFLVVGLVARCAVATRC